MEDTRVAPFLAGVNEGFYGRPWTQRQRFDLFDHLARLGLDTYCYGPKDDLKHRALWRRPYDAEEIAELSASVAACRDRGLRFFFALGPGLDIAYSSDADLLCLETRFEQLAAVGVDCFALLLDDIPDTMGASDRSVFGSFAEGHAHLANALWAWLRRRVDDALLLFCPTPYCGRMDAAALGGEGYLEEIGRRLDPAIRIFWTGPEIISETISDAHVDEVTRRLRRPPLIWDNLHANDYDQRRLFTGPLSDRPTRPRDRLAGILINPNCEYEANFVAVETLARYVSEAAEPLAPTETWQRALREWLPHFRGIGEAWTLEDLEFLSGVFYLPHEDGARARQLLDDVAHCLENSAANWGERPQRVRRAAESVQHILRKLTELENRELFHTFHRRWWDLNEEMQLIVCALDWRQAGGEGTFRSPEHLRGTYRGSTLTRLQSLLRMDESGAFEPARTRP